MALDPALAGRVSKLRQRRLGNPMRSPTGLLAWLTHLSDSELSRDARGQFYDDVRQAILLPGAEDAD